MSDSNNTQIQRQSQKNIKTISRPQCGTQASGAPSQVTTTIMEPPSPSVTACPNSLLVAQRESDRCQLLPPQAAQMQQNATQSRQKSQAVAVGQNGQLSVPQRAGGDCLMATAAKLRCSNEEQASQSQPSSNKNQSQNSKQQRARRKKKFLKFFVEFELHGRFYELDFKYDLEKDNPQKIAAELKEMKDHFNMPEEKIQELKAKIEMLVGKNSQKVLNLNQVKPLAAPQVPTQQEPIKAQADKDGCKQNQYNLKENGQNDHSRQQSLHMSAQAISSKVKQTRNSSDQQQQSQDIQEQIQKNQKSDVTAQNSNPSLNSAAAQQAEPDSLMIEKRRRVMRAKYNNLSCQIKRKNEGGSYMEPIEEDFLDASGNSNRSKNSLHQVSMGMLQPNIPYRANKSMVDEIYTVKDKDKIDCIQNTKLLDKKEFVCSMLYLHHSLNFSMEDPNNKQQKKNANTSSKQAAGLDALKKPQQSRLEQIDGANFQHNRSIQDNNLKAQNGDNEKKIVNNLGNVTWNNNNTPNIANKVQCDLWNSAGQALVAPFDIFDDQLDRNELIHIIETIPDIELSQSQLPGENFVYWVEPEYMKFQEQYHQQQEKLYQQHLQQSSQQQQTAATSKPNDTLLEFDINQDMHFQPTSESIGKQLFLQIGQSPKVEQGQTGTNFMTTANFQKSLEDISFIHPVQTGTSNNAQISTLQNAAQTQLQNMNTLPHNFDSQHSLSNMHETIITQLLNDLKEQHNIGHQQHQVSCYNKSQFSHEAQQNAAALGHSLQIKPNSLHPTSPLPRFNDSHEPSVLNQNEQANGRSEKQHQSESEPSHMARQVQRFQVINSRELQLKYEKNLFDNVAKRNGQKQRKSSGSQTSFTINNSMNPNINLAGAPKNSSSCVDGIQSDASLVNNTHQPFIHQYPHNNQSHDVVASHSHHNHQQHHLMQNACQQSSSKQSSVSYIVNQQIQGEQRSQKLLSQVQINGVGSSRVNTDFMEEVSGGREAVGQESYIQPVMSFYPPESHYQHHSHQYVDEIQLIEPELSQQTFSRQSNHHHIVGNHPDQQAQSLLGTQNQQHAQPVPFMQSISLAESVVRHNQIGHNLNKGSTHARTGSGLIGNTTNTANLTSSYNMTSTHNNNNNVLSSQKSNSSIIQFALGGTGSTQPCQVNTSNSHASQSNISNHYLLSNTTNNNISCSVPVAPSAPPNTSSIPSLLPHPAVLPATAPLQQRPPICPATTAQHQVGSGQVQTAQCGVCLQHLPQASMSCCCSCRSQPNGGQGSQAGKQVGGRSLQANVSSSQGSSIASRAVEGALSGSLIANHQQQMLLTCPGHDIGNQEIPIGSQTANNFGGSNAVPNSVPQ